ncbi:MAG: phage tail protein [Pseudomonadota bacterium]
MGGFVIAINYDQASSVWTVGYLIGEGPINAINEIYADDAELPASVSVNRYTGAPGQGVDPLLEAAIENYSDTLDGLAYFVLQFSSSVFDAWPTVVANIEGRLVLDPRTGLTEFTENPALHLADYLASTEYGPGYTVDTASVIAAADACDDTTGLGEARRQSHMVIDRPYPSEELIEVLRTYAGCMVAMRAKTALLIPDRPAAVAATYDHPDILEGTMSIRQADMTEVPTVVQVYYTDTSGREWRERLADEAAIPGAPRRVSQTRLPGIKRHSQAYREAVERLNKLQLGDLTADFVTFDEGIEREVGDIVEVTHHRGLTSKPLRLMQDPILEETGRWRIVGEEYDAAVYSNAVVTQPSSPDTNLPANTPPPAVTGLSLSETTYQLQNNKFASRIDISWNASANPFVTGYVIKVMSGDDVVFATITTATTAATSPLLEGIPYVVEVRPQTPVFTGDPAVDTYTIIGKTAIPDAPAALTGFEVGGDVRLSWPASTDVDAERYEIRYGPVGGTWEQASSLDITDALRLTSRDVPAGEWVFYVKTIDSIGQFSTDSAQTTITVTLDNDAFAAGAQIPLAPAAIGQMNNMHEVQEDRTSSARSYYTDSGQTWAQICGSVAMSSLGPLFTEQANTVSEFLSETLDLGVDSAGNFRGEKSVSPIGSPSTSRVLQTQVDGGPWVDEPTNSVNKVARAARFAIRSAADPMLIREGDGFVRVDVFAKEETGTSTSLVSGPRKIILSRAYVAARSLILLPQGSTALIPVYDNVILNDAANGNVTTFDVYIFDTSDNPVAADFQWQWKGV